MKNWGAVYLLICFLSINSYGGAPSCQDVQNRWYQKYVKDFKIAWDTSTFVCPGGESRLALAFWDLEANQYQPNSTGYKPDFYNFIFKQVVKFSSDDNCRYIAYTTGQEVHLCKRFFSDTREDRASTLVHESRHTQSDDPSHVTCIGGTFNGQKAACDFKFYDGAWAGSGFNADIHFLSWTLNKDTRTELSAEVLQNDINSMIPDRFNNITGEEINKWRR